MRVLFLRDIRKVGNKGDIKEVSGGYARNFLIANGFAKAVSESEVKTHTEILKLETVRAESDHKKNLELAEEISKRVFAIDVRAGAHGELFAAFGEKEIKNALARERISVQSVNLEKPIKSVGEYAVRIELERGVPVIVNFKIKAI